MKQQIAIFLTAMLASLSALAQTATVERLFDALKSADTATVYIVPPGVSFRAQLDQKTFQEVACVMITNDKKEIAELRALLGNARPRPAEGDDLTPHQRGRFEPRQQVLFRLDDGSVSTVTFGQQYSNRDYLDGQFNRLPIIAQRSIAADLHAWALSHGARGYLCKRLADAAAKVLNALPAPATTAH